MSARNHRGGIAVRLQAFAAENAILLIWAVFFVYALVFVEGFASLYNLKNYLKDCAPLLVAACGLTVVVLNGGVDFSTTSVISLVSTISAYILVKTVLADTVWAIIAAFVAGIGIGGVVGGINALAVSRLKMPSFVATLATKLVFSGLAVWFGNVFTTKYPWADCRRASQPSAARGIGLAPLVIAAAIYLLTWYLLHKTLFGRRVYAVGVNPNTAKVSGIPVRQTISLEMLFCGLLAGVAGLMYTAKNGSGVTTLGDSMYINIIGAVVIGGTNPSGGFGSTRKTLYGVLFLILLNNMLNLLGVHYTLYDVVKGVFLQIAAGLELLTRRMRRPSQGPGAEGLRKEGHPWLKPYCS